MNKKYFYVYQIQKNLSITFNAIFIFGVAGKKIALFDLKLDKGPNIVKYIGDSIAALQSTSSTIIEVRIS